MSSHSRRPSRRRAVTVWVFAAVAAILLLSVLWVAIRALSARDELLGAVPIAREIGDSVLQGGGEDLSGSIAELQERTASASSLTSDPIWRAYEYVPLLGANFVAFREAAAMIDGVAGDALPPLLELSRTLSLESLSPSDGAFDLSVFAQAQPLLDASNEALQRADVNARAIDTTGTVSQVGTAIDQVVGLVAEAKTAVDGLSSASSILPSMLGGDSPRSYLLLSLNNSELRSSGGIPGAIAVVNADEGRLSLGELSSASQLGEFDEPVMELSPEEVTLYTDVLGTYMQNVTATPDFARSGELAQAMWHERTGQTVDGVIALDPVALGYLLAATGPIDTGEGVQLTADTAADFLLSGVYAQFPDPKDQDRFFATATGLVFDAITHGNAQSDSLLDALTRAANEGRVHIWSSNVEEQSKLAKHEIAGGVPTTVEDASAFGVYFNDATGAKMDYYLRSSIAVASAVCRNDQRPNFDIRIKLTSEAPADAATSLPPYVTGDSIFGVEPGNVATNLFVYTPDGSVVYSVTIDGQEYAFVAAQHDGHAVIGVSVELEPGQESVVSVKLVGPQGGASAVSLTHTPMASAVPLSVDNYLDCAGVEPAPQDDDDEQTGALGERHSASAVFAEESIRAKK